MVEWIEVVSPVAITTDRINLVTIFSGRTYSLPAYFEAIKNLEVDWNCVTVIWIYGDPSIKKKLEKLLSCLPAVSKKLVPGPSAGFDKAPLHEVFHGKWLKKDKVLAEAYNLARDNWEFGNWLIVEDDIVVPPDVLKRFDKHKLIAGVVPHIRGGWVGEPIAWKFKKQSPVVADQLTYEREYFLLAARGMGKGVERVGATSLGCVKIDSDIILKYEFVPSYRGVFGTDVAWGRKLIENGVEWYIDWDVRCGHVTPEGEVVYAGSVIS